MRVLLFLRMAQNFGLTMGRAMLYCPGPSEERRDQLGRSLEILDLKTEDEIFSELVLWDLEKMRFASFIPQLLIIKPQQFYFPLQAPIPQNNPSSHVPQQQSLYLLLFIPKQILLIFLKKLSLICWFDILSIHYVRIEQEEIMSSDSEERSPSKRRSQDRSRSRSRERRAAGGQAKERKVKIKVPELTSNLYSFKHFANLQTEKMNPETIQKGYDKYKKDWENRQHEEFISQVRNEPWFNEKYNPELLDALEKERREHVKRLSEEFMARLDAGFYDKIDLRVNDVTQLGTIFQPDEEQEFHYNASSFISNQTIEIHINSGLDISKPPYYGFAPDSCTLFIRSLSREVARADIRTIVEKLEGFRTLTMSDPLKKANFSRNCWIEFATEEHCQKALLSMNGLMIKNETLSVSKAFTKVRKVKVLKNYPIGRLEADNETIARLIQRFDASRGITGSDLLARSFPSTQVRHDLLLLYLRRVHSFDYYTCTQYENQRVLALRTGAIFLRSEANYEELPNMQTVFKKIQENAEEKIQKMSTGEQDAMGLVRQEIERSIREVQKMAPGATRDIWKCLFCDKKFKTCEFLSKHMISRHEDFKNKKMAVVMDQLYLKDPNKITSYTIRDDRRKSFGGGFRREKRKEVYRDFDEPEGETQAKPVTKIMVNFLDI